MAWYSFTATSMGTSSSVSTCAFGEHLAIDNVFDLLQFFVGNLREVRKIEAQPVGMHRRTGLLHMRAQHLPQRRVQQVRAGVVAPDGVAPYAIHDGVHVVAHSEVLLENCLVRAHALHGQHAADDFGDGGVAVG